MKLPRFFSRIGDAVLPVLGLGERDELARVLSDTTVTLHADEAVTRSPAHAAGFLLAANLLARLYPRIRVVAPPAHATAAVDLVRAITPTTDVSPAETGDGFTLAYGTRERDAAAVHVAADGWNLRVDDPQPDGIPQAAPPAALAAAAIGVGELFRVVFADYLGARARRAPRPAVLNLVTLASEANDLPVTDEALPIGCVHLAGAGAVGEAAVETLRHCNVAGELVVVDPERIELSNLQRYVLARNGDEEAYKTAVVARALAGSGLRVKQVQARWGANKLSAPFCDTVLVALDTPADRVEVQGSLPRHIYNAWTQPLDLGWSRHEAFGRAPCLACLYWPNGPGPSRTRQIADALCQPEFRVVTYLLHRVPIDHPLQRGLIQAVTAAAPHENAALWAERSLLDDVADAFALDVGERERWRGRMLDDLYREGICGGAILRALTPDHARDMLVPMAHQSALAGIMLATTLIIARTATLRDARPASTEARIDMLAGLPQHLARPRLRTPRCLCADADFVRAHETRWNIGQ